MSVNKTVRTPWTAEEDNALIELVSKYGTVGTWPSIAQTMKIRSGKQCRDRYINHLDPSIRKEKWTREEDNIIREMHAKVGSQWSQYVPFLSGRTDNTIKNRYHVISRYALNGVAAVQPALKRHKSETSSAHTSNGSAGADSTSQPQFQISDQAARKISVLKSMRDRLDSEINSLTEHISSGRTDLAPHVVSTSEDDIEKTAGLVPDLDAFDFDWGELNTSALTYEQMDSADLKQLLGTVLRRNEDM